MSEVCAAMCDPAGNSSADNLADIMPFIREEALANIFNYNEVGSEVVQAQARPHSESTS